MVSKPSIFSFSLFSFSRIVRRIHLFSRCFKCLAIFRLACISSEGSAGGFHGAGRERFTRPPSSIFLKKLLRT